LYRSSFIIEQGGKILLGLFGVTDVLNCVTKGDLQACGMALIRALRLSE
jgi:hypothetical protein